MWSLHQKRRLRQLGMLCLALNGRWAMAILCGQSKRPANQDPGSELCALCCSLSKHSICFFPWPKCCVNGCLLKIGKNFSLLLHMTRHP